MCPFSECGGYELGANYPTSCGGGIEGPASVNCQTQMEVPLSSGTTVGPQRRRLKFLFYYGSVALGKWASVF